MKYYKWNAHKQDESMADIRTALNVEAVGLQPSFLIGSIGDPAALYYGYMTKYDLSDFSRLVEWSFSEITAEEMLGAARSFNESASFNTDGQIVF